MLNKKCIACGAIISKDEKVCPNCESTIYIKGFYGDKHCTNCDALLTEYTTNNYKYCPHCGIKIIDGGYNYLAIKKDEEQYFLNLGEN